MRKKKSIINNSLTMIYTVSPTGLKKVYITLLYNDNLNQK